MALALLYALELHNLGVDYAGVAKPYVGQADRWWVSVDGEAQGIFTFKDGLRLLLDGRPNVAVLHESAAELDPAPWTGLTYQAWWSHPGTALAWTVGFWTICAMIGWAIVCLISPFWLQTPAQIVYWLAVAFFAIKLGAPTQVDAVRSQVSRLLRRTPSSPQLLPEPEL